MNYRNISNATKRQFNSVLQKEGITLTDYFDKSITYRVFFRKNNRGNAGQGKVRIFYAQDTPISIGTTFVLKDNISINFHSKKERCCCRKSVTDLYIF